jgi:hypothetical protein
MLNLKKLSMALFTVVFSVRSDFDRISEEDRINRGCDVIVDMISELLDP